MSTIDYDTDEVADSDGAGELTDLLDARLDHLQGDINQLTADVHAIQEQVDRLDARFPEGPTAIFDHWLDTLRLAYCLTDADLLAIRTIPGMFQDWHALHLYHQEAFGRRGSGQAQCNWHNQLLLVLGRQATWTTLATRASRQPPHLAPTGRPPTEQ